MVVKVQKWGNSLALRIPSSLAAETNLKPGAVVNLSLQDGKLVITPAPTGYSLEELLEKVSETNLHGEVPTGYPQGNEQW